MKKKCVQLALGVRGLKDGDLYMGRIIGLYRRKDGQIEGNSLRWGAKIAGDYGDIKWKKWNPNFAHFRGVPKQYIHVLEVTGVKDQSRIYKEIHLVQQ